MTSDGDRRRLQGRRRIDGAQQAVDGEGLTAHLGRHPPRDHGDETGRPHHHRQQMHEPPVIEAMAQSGE